MKKVLTLFATLPILFIASLCFIACSSDDDESDGTSTGQKTLTIDGTSYYCGSGSSVEQTRGNGMYLEVRATEDPIFEWNGKVLIVHISPSNVSQLSVGDIFDYDDISIRNYNNVTTIELNAYSWDAIDGSIQIKDIKEKELTIQINNLVVKHESTGAEHTISGTAKLGNSVYDSNGNMLPFSEI